MVVGSHNGMESCAHFWNLARTLTLLWWWWREVLPAANPQCDIDYGRPTECWRSFQMRRRWPNLTFTVIIHVYLKVCIAADCHMFINLKKLHKHQRQRYLDISELAWTPKTDVLTILKICGKGHDHFLLTGGRQRLRGLLMDVHICTSARWTTTLLWKPCMRYAKQRYANASMGIYDLSMGTKRFICSIHAFTSTPVLPRFHGDCGEETWI